MSQSSTATPPKNTTPKRFTAGVRILPDPYARPERNAAEDGWRSMLEHFKKPR